MNNIKVTTKCAYCNKNIKTYAEPYNESDKRLINLLIKDNTTLCKRCANNSEARVWLSTYILNSVKNN